MTHGILLRSLFALFAVAVVPTISVAIGLNDTGADMCGDSTAMNTSLCPTYSSDASLFPRQDANLGRDAAARAGTLVKTGAGKKGFDFTKIANSGSALPATAVLGSGTNDWACTRDNATGLVWEVKTTSGLHSAADTFSWYQAGVGVANGGTCQISGNCNTENFVTNVNNANFCGFSDWRMPSIKELEGLADFGIRLQTLDPAYFPNTANADIFWSTNPDPTHTPTQYAYAFLASTGGVVKAQTLSTYRVRLVRGTPVTRQFVQSGNVVLDAIHGLMWKRDYEMLSPGNPSPNVNVDTFNWSDALRRAVSDTTGGFNDWRLPNIKELRSLVDETRFNSAIDPAFNTLLPASNFWSSTPAQNFNFYSDLSWVVQFNSGVNVNTTSRSAKMYVRLVRNLAVGQQTISPISFSPTTLAVNGTTTASATASSGLAVTFSSADSSICTVSGSVVTALHGGTCTIRANQAGNTLFAPAPQVTQSIPVSKIAQTIGTVSFSPVSLAIGGTTTVSATASSGLAVSFDASVTPTICSVSGAVVTGLASGQCTITATQIGNNDYLQVTKTESVTVKKAQTIDPISFTHYPVPAGTTSQASAASPGGSSNPVTFSTSSPSNICTVSGAGVVTAVGIGTCVVIANQDGDTEFAAAAPRIDSLPVTQGTQTIGPISFTPSTLAVGGTVTLSAVASKTGTTVTFLTSPGSICTVSGNIVTGKAKGRCTVNVLKTDDPNYAPAYGTSINIDVSEGSQVISNFTFTPADLAISGITTASATGGLSGNPVTFSSDTTGTCFVGGTNGSVVTARSTGGLCTIRASQAGNADYLAATPITRNITIKNGQTITGFTFSPATLAVNGTTTASATVIDGAPGKTVTFSSLTQTVCTVEGAVVTGKKYGECTIAANQLGDENFTPAPQITANIQVDKGTQLIEALSFSATSLGINGTTTVNATASSGGTVTFSVSTPLPDPLKCSVAGNVVTGLSVGNCSITASAVHPDYNDATASGTIDVKDGQTIGAISFTPSTLAVGGTTTASATTTANLPASFASATEGICTVGVGNVFTGVSTGRCYFNANQAGTTTIAEAPPVFDFIDVSQGTQTIGAVSFSPASLSIGGTSTVSATATSGYAVTYSSSTPACSVSGNVVLGLLAGTCTITASQDGKLGGVQNYNAVTSTGNSTVVGPVILFNPTSLSFSDQNIGTTSVFQTVQLKNTGASTLNITGIEITVNPNDFVHPTGLALMGCSSATLAPNASCTLRVSFKPTVAGTRIATLKVNGNNPTDSPQVNLTGTGVGANVPVCTLSAAPAKIAPGKTSTLTTSCSNTPTSYTWTGGTCAGTTAATCTVTPGETTTYGVIATNGNGSSSSVSATVTVKPVDLTPILMLLLD